MLMCMPPKFEENHKYVTYQQQINNQPRLVDLIKIILSVACIVLKERNDTIQICIINK